MATIVLDASAVIALLREEPGAETVAQHAGDAAISAVNWQEIAKELLITGIPMPAIKQMLTELHLDVRAHTEADAFDAAKLAQVTQKYGRGLGDRSCMALAMQLGVPALTTDRAWAKLEIPGLEIRLAR